jgi:hypothetical protein
MRPTLLTAMVLRAVGHATASRSSVPVLFLKAFDERALLTYYCCMDIEMRQRQRTGATLAANRFPLFNCACRRPFEPVYLDQGYSSLIKVILLKMPLFVRTVGSFSPIFVARAILNRRVWTFELFEGA